MLSYLLFRCVFPFWSSHVSKPLFSFFNVPLINYSRSPHAPFSLSCFSTLFDSPKRRRLSLVVVCLIVLMRVSVCGTNSDQFQFFSPDDAVGFSFFFFVERIFFSCFFDFFFFFIFPHFLLSISLYFSYFSLRSASFFPLPFNVKKGGNELCQRCHKKKSSFFCLSCDIFICIFFFFFTLSKTVVFLSFLSSFLLFL